MKAFKHSNDMSASTPGLRLVSSNSSSRTNGFKNQRDKNQYGSLEDLQAYALQTRNHNLTVKLVEAKKDWETLQALFRANTHARFLYQTALARIVNHVQDFSDPDDPAQTDLVNDLVKWAEECEHIVSQQNRDMNMSSTASENSHDSGQEILKGNNSLHGLSGSNRTPIIDYNDVQVYMDTSLQAHASNIPSAWMNNESVQQQNDNLEKEILKWTSSMARIRICNRREASELLTHQKTLRKVVERVQESNFGRKDQVVEWYETCQREAEKCDSFSEQDAAKYCHRCNSRFSNTDDDDEKKDTSGVYLEETKTLYPPPSTTPPKKAPLRVEVMDCPDTPDTVASHHDEAAATPMSNDLGKEEESVTKAIQLAHDNEHQHKNAAGVEVEHELKTRFSAPSSPKTMSLPTVQDIAAANVEDPPDRINPHNNATNLQTSSIVQDKHATTKCGAGICCIM